MPELPEVQTIVDTLRPLVLGRRVQRFELLREDFAQPAGFDWKSATARRRIVNLQRRAKRLVFTLDDGNVFYAHLGMTGRLSFGAADRPRARHTHVAVMFARGELHFVDARRFGGLAWIGRDAADDGLGPEPLALRASQLARRLAGTKRAIKTALLDQRLIAGLGNIYADEALFAAGIHPLRPANRLDAAEVARLSRAIKATLRKAIRHRGSTLRDYVDANGRAGSFRNLHQVYGRAGEECSRCGKAIKRIVLGGRSTNFCTKCQGAAKKPRR